MYQFGSFEGLESHLAQQQATRQGSFQETLAEARLAFLDFCEFHGHEDLEDLTQLSLESLRYQRNRVEPYAYLAFAMFCAKSDVLGHKYLKIARELDPNDPLVQRMQKHLLRGQ